jgi:hypothetical protein
MCADPGVGILRVGRIAASVPTYRLRSGAILSLDR